VYQASVADLGTAMNPGNKVFQNQSNASVFAESSVPVAAIGNTWNPNAQSADLTESIRQLPLSWYHWQPSTAAILDQ
jgi:hypothetical protein